MTVSVRSELYEIIMSMDIERDLLRQDPAVGIILGKKPSRMRFIRMDEDEDEDRMRFSERLRRVLGVSEGDVRMEGEEIM